MVKALRRQFQGAACQRCQTHLMRNVLGQTPRHLKAEMTAWLRRIFRSESKAEARQAFSELARELDGRGEKALQTLEAGLEDAIAVLALPAKYRRRLRTTNIVDRLIEEIRRRERVIRIFPNSASAHRLIGALLQEQHEEWLTGRGTSNGNRAAGHHPARPPPSSTPHNVVLNTHDIADGFLQQNWGLIGWGRGRIVMTSKAQQNHMEGTARAVIRYEKRHAVDTYRVNGWHVWPILRTWVREKIARPYALSEKQSVQDNYYTFARKLKGYAQIVVDRFEPYFDSYDIRPDRLDTDIVILTRASRRQEIDGASIHYFADVLGEELDKMGVSVTSWERGEPPSPRYRVSSRVDPRLDFAVRMLRKVYGGCQIGNEPPGWFEEVARWTKEDFGWCFQWSRAKSLIQMVDDQSRVIERWLERAGCKCVFVDTWYSWEGMSATLACNRLGISSIDLQHGMQGEMDLSYAHWKNVPKGGYEVVPDYFWFWGHQDAQSFEATNNHPYESIIGGNVWLNRWRDGSSFGSAVSQAKKVASGFEKAILVTLQPGLDLQFFVDTVRKSKSSYCWLIRLHRSYTDQLDELRRQFEKAAANSRVVLDEATRLPLYALFQAVDAHVTGYSTCALEALAFGMPTVVMHERAREAYKKYLDTGVMFLAKEPEDVLRGLEMTEDVSPGSCREWADEVFVPPKRSEEAVQRIAAYCARAGGGKKYVSG